MTRLFSSEDLGEARPHKLREPCRYCGGTEGRIARTNGQDVVRCNGCDRAVYNAPRTETGERKTTTQSVHKAIDPRLRASVIVRANRACELCQATDVQLEVGHLMSVHDGVQHGFDARFLNSPENLAAMCTPCNQGVGARTLPLRNVIAILHARERRWKAAAR